jgi:hypothetical protein
MHGVLVDTRSSLFWVGCEPCNNLGLCPVFDPDASFTFNVVKCWSALCSRFPSATMSCGTCEWSASVWERGQAKDSSLAAATYLTALDDNILEYLAVFPLSDDLILGVIRAECITHSARGPALGGGGGLEGRPPRAQGKNERRLCPNCLVWEGIKSLCPILHGFSY